MIIRPLPPCNSYRPTATTDFLRLYVTQETGLTNPDAV